eukprot:9946401-Alexandrium_andersonii.AAC.1
MSSPVALPGPPAHPYARFNRGEKGSNNRVATLPARFLRLSGGSAAPRAPVAPRGGATARPGPPTGAFGARQRRGATG